jgi:hypothetical protein
MFLGVSDLHPDPLVKGTDPKPYVISKNSKKKLDSHCFVTSYDFLSMKNYVNLVQKLLPKKNNCLLPS